MAVRGSAPRRAMRASRAGLAPAAALAAAMLAGCNGLPAAGGGDGRPHDPAPAAAQRPRQPVSLSLSVPRGARDVGVDTDLSVTAANGSIRDVLLSYGDAFPTRVGGRLSPDKTAWRAADLLEPGQRYRVVVHAETPQGQPTTKRSWFTTQPLTLDQQTYASISPLQGKTVGVGMPVIVKFDVPVNNRASIERHLSVTSTPSVQGSWHWISDTEVHFRPREFWPTGTKVSVDANINGVDAGNGIYGQEDRHVSFRIGDSVVDKINVKTHRLKVYVNGRLARTIPVTSGAKGTETRGGTKVIVEKLRSTRMNAASTGIPRSDPNYYNIPDVQFAMRVTYSGEFLHAAPWSVASQGSANVSHGCVGMSTANARWLYQHSQVGDVVKVVGSHRRLEPNNGWTDWNEPFSQYRQASALH